jgi:UDPglucose 6-dehydrogenase
MALKLCVVGLGKLGSPLAALLASKGHDVTGIDTDSGMVAAINEGRAPVAEPGLQELIAAARPRLQATQSWDEAVAASDASFLVVPTPSEGDGGFSNKYLLDAVSRIGEVLRRSDGYHVVVVTSTVMPGSMDGPIRAALEAASGRTVGKTVGLCYNPEFIALGTVISDMQRPDLILLGESDTQAGDIIECISRSITENSPPVQRMALVNAEIAKLALNAYVTMKISFANFIAELSEKLPGGDCGPVLTALGKDARIGGKYLKGAMGYGGPCFPRDSAAIASLASRLGVDADLALATDTVNRRQAARLAALVRAQLTDNGAVAILGLAYKPQTPVVEQSQGLMLAADLAGGARVTVHDPLALENAQLLLGDDVRYAATLEEAVSAAAVIVIATPDPSFRALPAILEKRGDAVVIFDCWGLLAETPARARVIRLGAQAPAFEKPAALPWI